MSVRCRFCGAGLGHTFCDLGMSPLSNAYLDERQIREVEPFYPLHAYVCADCYLVQLLEYAAPGTIFSDYAYFSSYSQSWLDHAAAYAAMMRQRMRLGPGSLVVEVGSNDGYLLRNFVAHGIPVLGVEPAANVAAVAQDSGIQTVVAFFGSASARRLVSAGRQADLLIANNVLAHVPDINDFVAGLKLALKPDGVITLEFPHLLRLMADTQFDTIYHEHFSYLSLATAARILERHGLAISDVQELPTHGGSLRVFAGHARTDAAAAADSVAKVLQEERSAGLGTLPAYLEFPRKVEALKRDILAFLIDAKRTGKRIAGYGAPAKGNTLLNYCGVRQDFIDYTVDLSPHKQGKYLPGTHIPIFAPQRIAQTRPDYLLILPWNLTGEIVQQMAGVREWGCRFVVPVPRMTVLP